MAKAPRTTGVEHSSDQLQRTMAIWRLHLTQALRTAVVAGQMKHPLAQRVRNVQLLGLALQRGHHAPLERTLAVEKLSFSGRLGPRRLGHGARPHRGGAGSCRRRKHVRSPMDSLRSVADASTQTASTIVDANGESERRCWREASTADPLTACPPLACKSRNQQKQSQLVRKRSKPLGAKTSRKSQGQSQHI